MNRFYIIIIIAISFLGCINLKPKDFTYQYRKGQTTGLDTLIDIDGYYITQRECNSSFNSIFKFYPDGLFIIATGTDLTEVVSCFENDATKNKTICQYPSWGVYKVVNNTIKTQTVRQEGIGFCTIFRDYKILKDKTIENISDYVVPENTNIGYMRNYPSFKENNCSKKAIFHHSENTIGTEYCPYLKKKWFSNK